VNENIPKLELPSWLETIAVFDTETTGLNLREDRIVTASIQRLSSNGVVLDGGKDWVINPGIPIPEIASKVHGYYDKDVKDSPSSDIAIPEILETINACFAEGIPVLAYNAAYDFTILHYEAKRYGLHPVEFGVVIDPLVIDKTIDKYRKGKRTLAAAAERYNISLDNAHTAKDDAIAAGQVGLGMLRFFIAQTPKVVPFPSSAQELHDQQSKWADEIEASYAKWRQTDVPDYKPLFGWPVKDFS
jgi:DNA polymerase-3 subunit epsilon